jgi:hypothetical protein
MNEWKSSGGRVTLFPAQSPAPTLSALDLYKQVWGADPDSFQRQANPLVPTIAQGRRGGLTVGSVAGPTRVDFTLTPPSPPEMTQGSFPLIEDPGILHAELLRIMDVIGQGGSLRSVVRVALSVQFIAVKASSAEANKVLTAVIPGQYGIKLTDEEDFIFQVNRPYPSRKAEGVRMNFLVKWSVDRLQILTLSLPVGGAATPLQTSASPTPQTEQFIAASIHFDINNVPTEAPLQQPASVLNEALVAAAQMQQSIGLRIEGFSNAKQPH